MRPAGSPALKRMAIMQPYLFPYLGYFQLIVAADRFMFYDDVAYIKQGWINRNRIRSGNDEIMFTVPLQGASSHAMIKDIPLDQGRWPHWRSKFLRTLEQSYRKAPFRDATLGLVQEVLDVGPGSIADLAVASVERVLKHYGCTTPLSRSSVACPATDLTGEDRLIAMCKAEGAAGYLNMSGGRTLYTASNWARNGMTLEFLEPVLRPYGAEGTFQPGLSVIDAMMHILPDRMRQLHWQGRITE